MDIDTHARNLKRAGGGNIHIYYTTPNNHQHQHSHYILVGRRLYNTLFGHTPHLSLSQWMPDAVAAAAVGHCFQRRRVGRVQFEQE
jgi:hypothetical protein